MTSRTGLLLAATALVMMVGVTIVQGTWTNRWGKPQNQALEEAARRLEHSFPSSFGAWSVMPDQQPTTTREELERAGAVGSVTRAYLNSKTKVSISAFVVCASAPDASGHTPDRCYPGAGFEIAEPEHRQSIVLRDGRVAEAFTGTFTREGQTLRIFWTYGVPEKKPGDATPREDGDAAEDSNRLTWIAPQIARITLNDYPAVYKLYAIINQTKLPNSRAMSESTDFLAELLPAFDAALAADASKTAPAAAPVAEPAAQPAADAGDAKAS